MPNSVQFITIGQVLLYAIAGMAAGWTVNYLADVLPIFRKLAAPVCVGCGKRLPPAVYLAWMRRCPACRRGRGGRTWLVMLVCMAGFVWLGLAPKSRLGVWGGWFWFAYLLLVTVIDIEHHLILHTVAGFGAAVALITGVALHGWLSTLLGGLVGAGFMLVFYYLGIVYARWSARRHGMQIAEGEALGFGDVTFSGVLGLLLGWPGVLGGLVIGVLLAGAASLLALLPMALRREYNPNLALPYGPFLAAAAFYLLFLQ
jgi:leader peptidase (prepilin peptidase)/N-methyltransferase